MATSAKIIALGARRAPSPSNTMEGRFYLQRKSRLSVAGRRALKSLEDDLFRDRAASVDTPGVLARPERLHQVPGLGYIAYFWSRVEHMYVLSEFGLEDTDAGGGVPCYAEASVRPCGASARPPRRALAAVAWAFAHRTKPAGDLVSAVVRQLHLFRSRRDVAGRGVRSDWPSFARASEESAADLTSELLAIHARLAGGGPLGRDDLPRWSLLRALVTVPEELHNPFARTLVAGEIVCRLGAATDAAMRHSERMTSLLRFLEAGSEWFTCLASRSRHDEQELDQLIGTWLADSAATSMAEDVRRLNARARLSIVLASHVGRSAFDTAAIASSSGTELIDPSIRLVLRKLKLMTEYVTLSYQDVVTASPSLKRDYPPVPQKGSSSFLDEFERSIVIIAHQIETPEPMGSHAGKLRERIHAIAAEIIATPDGR